MNINKMTRVPKVELFFFACLLGVVSIDMLTRQEPTFGRLMARSILGSSVELGLILGACSTLVTPARFWRFAPCVFLLIYATFLLLHGIRNGGVGAIIFKTAYWSIEQFMYLALTVGIGLTVVRFLISIRDIFEDKKVEKDTRLNAIWARFNSSRWEGVL